MKFRAIHKGVKVVGTGMDIDLEAGQQAVLTGYSRRTSLGTQYEVSITGKIRWIDAQGFILAIDENE